MDCWALGCIMGELLNHAPLMPGRTEMHQLELIVRLLGSPSDAIWPGMSALPFARSFHLPAQPYNNISTKVSSSHDLMPLRLISAVWIHILRRHRSAQQSADIRPQAAGDGAGDLATPLFLRGAAANRPGPHAHLPPGPQHQDVIAFGNAGVNPHSRTRSRIAR